MTALRVVLADRSPLVRLAVRSALQADGIAVVAEAEDARTAIAACERHAPDALLLDSEVDEDMTAIAQVHSVFPDAALIVLSPDASDYRALAAVRAGACGFLPKDTSPDRLPDIVRGAVAGEAAIPRALVRRLLAHVGSRGELFHGASGDASAEPLTARERQVLKLLAQGLADRQIGHQLGVAEVTVRRHVATASRKLHTDGREDAVEAYRRLIA